MCDGWSSTRSRDWLFLPQGQPARLATDAAELSPSGSQHFISQRLIDYSSIIHFSLVHLLPQPFDDESSQVFAPSSKRLVSLIQGVIWVHSRVNESSQFMFTITSKVNVDRDSPALRDRIRRFRGRTILFVNVHRKDPEVARRIGDLGLHSLVVIRSRSNISMSFFDAIIIDSLEVVSIIAPCYPRRCLV